MASNASEKLIKDFQDKAKEKEFEISRAQDKLNGLLEKLQGAGSSIGIISKIGRSTTNEYISLQQLLQEKRKVLAIHFTGKLSGFFGSKMISIILLAISVCLGIFWGFNHLGLDFLMGNTYLTLTVLTISMVLIDSLSYLFINAIYHALESKYAEDRVSYGKILVSTNLIVSVIGLAAFILMIFIRIREAI